uniref:Ubiquitin carboxyl-terminal hydrolase n=2 Tax=Rhizophora mucronata TaxID=61149 RepID=A0A2P2J9K5_RHIMU
MGGLQFQLQMSWQPSLLSQKRKNGPPLGLRNLGNSCYLNSVLQCLTYTPPLANFCLRFQHSSLCDSVSNGERKRDCPFCIVEKQIVRSLSTDLSLDAPAKIQSCLRVFAEHFRLGRQEDAHEFLRYVIDACHNTCLRLKKLRRSKGGGAGDSANNNGNSTVVKEIFGGALQSQVKCLSCNSESNKVDEIMDISLDVLHSSSLKDAMQKFFKPEILDGNNKYKCENCKKLVAAMKQMSILQAPNILVIQLKRFEGVFGGKIDKPIAFEEVLVLSNFMCKTSQDTRPEYNLFGTIVHSGYSPESGHYYAYIKDAMGRWYCCNDSYVTLSTLQDVLSEKVYILFFSRTSQKSVPSSKTLASNGVKSCTLNGSEASKNPKSAVPLKTVATKTCTALPLRKDVPAVCKDDKVPSATRVKFNISGNSGNKRVSPTVDRKFAAHKSQNSAMNGDVKQSTTEKLKKGTSSVMSANDFKSKQVGNSNADSCQAFAVAIEDATPDGTVSSIMPHLRESNGIINGVAMIRGPNHHKLQNGNVNHHSNTPGSKRKLKNSCILLAEDTESQGKVEELKKVLNQEASAVLKSCGWSDKVYKFMHSRKRLCAQEVEDNPSGDDLKNLLIAGAKSTFLSQIPESLKEDLIKCLRMFSQEK